MAHTPWDILKELLYYKELLYSTQAIESNATDIVLSQTTEKDRLTSNIKFISNKTKRSRAPSTTIRLNAHFLIGVSNPPVFNRSARPKTSYLQTSKIKPIGRDQKRNGEKRDIEGNDQQSIHTMV